MSRGYTPLQLCVRTAHTLYKLFLQQQNRIGVSIVADSHLTHAGKRRNIAQMGDV